MTTNQLNRSGSTVTEIEALLLLLHCYWSAHGAAAETTYVRISWQCECQGPRSWTDGVLLANA